MPIILNILSTCSGDHYPRHVSGAKGCCIAREGWLGVGRRPNSGGGGGGRPGDEVGGDAGKARTVGCGGQREKGENGQAMVRQVVVSLQIHLHPDLKL